MLRTSHDVITTTGSNTPHISQKGDEDGVIPEIQMQKKETEGCMQKKKRKVKVKESKIKGNEEQ